MSDLEDLNGMTRYFDNRKHSDIIVHFSNRQVHAYKVILASKSDHFRMILEGNFMESSARDIRLEEDDPEALYGLLAWCYDLVYTGKTTCGDRIKYERYGDSESAHVNYLINLRIAAGKCLIPDLQDQVWYCIWDILEDLKVGKPADMTDEELLRVFDVFASFLYGPNADSKCLYILLPSSITLVKSYSAKSTGNLVFKRFLLKTPELAYDVMTETTESLKQLRRTMDEPAVQGLRDPRFPYEPQSHCIARRRRSKWH